MKQPAEPAVGVFGSDTRPSGQVRVSRFAVTGPGVQLPVRTIVYPDVTSVVAPAAGMHIEGSGKEQSLSTTRPVPVAPEARSRSGK